MKIHRVEGRIIGGKTSPTYNSWDNMIGRCTRPSQPDFDKYGGRGITVCSEWRGSFAKFRKDMGDRPKGKTLDRENVNGNYEKDNCRWASSQEQQNNKTTSVRVPHKGVLLTIKELSIKTKVKESTLWSRKRSGIPLERLAHNTPSLLSVERKEKRIIVNDLFQTIKNMSEISRQTGIPILSVRKYLGK